MTVLFIIDYLVWRNGEDGEGGGVVLTTPPRELHPGKYTPLASHLSHRGDTDSCTCWREDQRPASKRNNYSLLITIKKNNDSRGVKSVSKRSLRPDNKIKRETNQRPAQVKLKQKKKSVKLNTPK